MKRKIQISNSNSDTDNKKNHYSFHSVKSVRTHSYFGPYSVRMWESTDQNNFEYGHLLCIVPEYLQFLYLKHELQKQPPEVFRKKDVLKNFKNFTGKHLCWSIFLIKLQTCGSVLKNICKRLLLQLCTKNYFEVLSN